MKGEIYCRYLTVRFTDDPREPLLWFDMKLTWRNRIQWVLQGLFCSEIKFRIDKMKEE